MYATEEDIKPRALELTPCEAQLLRWLRDDARDGDPITTEARDLIRRGLASPGQRGQFCGYLTRDGIDALERFDKQHDLSVDANGDFAPAPVFSPGDVGKRVRVVSGTLVGTIGVIRTVTEVGVIFDPGDGSRWAVQASELLRYGDEWLEREVTLRQLLPKPLRESPTINPPREPTFTQAELARAIFNREMRVEAQKLAEAGVHVCISFKERTLQYEGASTPRMKIEVSAWRPNSFAEVDRILDIMWNKTKPDARAKAENEAAWLVSIMRGIL